MQIKIRVKTLTGRTFEIDSLKSTDDLESLKQRIKEVEGTLRCRQRIILCGKDLQDDGRTLADYGIKDQTLIFLIQRKLGGGSGGIRIQIYTIQIKTSAGGTKTMIEVESGDTIEEVIDKFVAKAGIVLHDSRVRLLFNGQELATNQTVAQHHIKSGDTLEFRKQVVSEPAV